MKITNDILKDYFYDKCSHEEEIEIQKWLTENDNDQVDQRFREIISEISRSDSTQTGPHLTAEVPAYHSLDTAGGSRPFHPTFVFSRIFASHQESEYTLE